MRYISLPAIRKAPTANTSVDSGIEVLGIGADRLHVGQLALGRHAGGQAPATRAAPPAQNALRQQALIHAPRQA
jgi:hypothetical protein